MFKTSFYLLVASREQASVGYAGYGNFVETTDGHKSAMIDKQTSPHRSVAIALSASEQINNYSSSSFSLRDSKTSSKNIKREL